MSLSPDAPRAASRSALIAVAILIVAGYGLTLLVFYPGVMASAIDEIAATAPRQL